MTDNELAAALLIAGMAFLVVIAFAVAVLGVATGLYQLNAHIQTKRAEHAYEKRMSEQAERTYKDLF